jgi:nucleoid-associated protein YgaU
MGHGRKYVVVVLMMVTAGYAAHQFRRAPSERIVPIAASSPQLATPAQSAVAPQLPKPRGQLPVTALADPERVPTAVLRQEKPEAKAPPLDKQPTVQRNADKPGDRAAGPKKGNSKNAESKKPDGKKPGGRKANQENSAEGRQAAVARAVPKALTVGDLKPATPPKIPTLAKKERPSLEQPVLNADADPPPQLADRYQPVLSRLDLANPRDEVPTPPWRDSQPGAGSRATPPVAAADQERRHRVADGDTLAQLAQRYLGDERRYLEILCANREILKDPSWLPIGIELIIPAGDDEAGAIVRSTPAKSTVAASASAIPRESPSSVAVPKASAVKTAREPSVTSPPRATGSPPQVPSPSTATPQAASEGRVSIPWDSLPPPPKRG